MEGYPKTPEEARQRVLDVLNKIIEVDEPFARLLVQHRYDVPDSVMDAEGKDEVQIVVSQNPEGKWTTSTLGVINGILEALGCGRIQAHLEKDDEGNMDEIIEYLPYPGKPDPQSIIGIEDQRFLDGVKEALECTTEDK